jgi:hypothetical protein
LAAGQGLPPTAALFAYARRQGGGLLKSRKARADMAQLPLSCVRKSTYVHGQLQAELVVVHHPQQGLHMLALAGFVMHGFVDLLHDAKRPLAQVRAHGVFVVAGKAHDHLLGVQQQAAAVAVNGGQWCAHDLKSQSASRPITDWHAPTELGS